MAGKGKTKHYKLPNALRRRAYKNTLDRVSVLGDITHRANTIKESDLIRNKAYIEHKQRVNGAIARLRRQRSWLPLPNVVADMIGRTAFRTCNPKGE